MHRASFFEWKLTSLLKLIILVQFLMNISILVDITYVRQILGFIYLTFVPGMLLLKAFRVKNSKLAESILFSVGLSLALVMFVGLIINELYPLIGISEPLSTISFLITINIVIFLLCFVCYFRDKDRILPTSFSFSSLVFPFICLPLLSFLGTFLVNASGNNFLLLLMMAMIPPLAVLGGVSKRLLPPNLYPLAVFCITITLLFHISLITNYIVGWDVNAEYHVFGLTKNNLRWHRAGIPGTFDNELLSANAMLSVTILPTIYTEILKLSGSFVFKTLYQFIFSLVPFALYQLWYSQTGKKHLGALGVFLSAFFIVSIQMFFRFSAVKQMIAELFFVLLFLLLFDKKMEPLKRKTLLLIFGAALIVSHYATSYLFMFLIFTIWLLSFFQAERKVSLSFLVYFFVTTFSWYLYTSSSGTLDNTMKYGDHVLRNFSQDFFDPGSRGSVVLSGLGLSAPPSFLHQISRIFFYATEAFIIIGIIKLIIERNREMKIDKSYFALTCLNFLILLTCVAIPNFASMLRMERFYHFALLFLGPMCILGGKTLFALLLRRMRRPRTELLTLVPILVLVLIPVLLFESEFVYAIAGDDSMVVSIALNMDAVHPLRLYNQITVEQEVVGARWLSTYRNKSALVYADTTSVIHVLTSYGMTQRDRMRSIPLNFTIEKFYVNLRLEGAGDRTYIYLRRLNTVHGMLTVTSTQGMNITEIFPILNCQNKIYSNRDCDIYKVLSES